MSNDAWEIINKRRGLPQKKQNTISSRLRARINIEHCECDKVVQMSARADKRRYLEDQALTAQAAADNGNMGPVYKITKELSGKSGARTHLVKDSATGKVTADPEIQREIWTQHFSKLLNQDDPTLAFNLSLPVTLPEVDINLDPPDAREIREAILTLRNGKAAGVDELPSEFFNCSTDMAVRILQPLFKAIWQRNCQATEER